MIISASRRTDIPAYFGQWFTNRLREGFVYVRNPFNSNAVSDVRLSPDTVDAVAFWTKNPKGFMQYLDKIDGMGYKYYFQFALNGYGNQVEVNLPDVDTLIGTFAELSQRIGKEKTQWRYSPVVFTDKMNFSWHKAYFEFLASSLSAYTEVCIISFLDEYKKINKRLDAINAYRPPEETVERLTKEFRDIAKSYGLTLQTCTDYKEIEGIERLGCINQRILEKVTGKKYDVPKDKSQRASCACIQSVDIGEYDSCINDCVYCYANKDSGYVKQNKLRHDPDSPLLLGEITKDMIIKERKEKPLKSGQPTLFEL